MRGVRGERGCGEGGADSLKDVEGQGMEDVEEVGDEGWELWLETVEL